MIPFEGFFLRAAGRFFEVAPSARDGRVRVRDGVPRLVEVDVFGRGARRFGAVTAPVDPASWPVSSTSA